MPKSGTPEPTRPRTASAAPTTASGSPGPFERKMPSGVRASTSAAGVDAGHDVHVAAGPGEVTQDRALDAEVVGDDVERRIGVAVRVRRRGGDRRDEVLAVGRLAHARRGAHRRLVGAERAGHRTVVAQVAGEAAGVDARDRRDPVPGEERVERLGGPPVAVAAGEVADDHALTERRRRLVVVGVGAVVADVRVGERDDLSGVARVGDDLLVARQRGVEHDLAGPGGEHVGADRLALERLAVAQDQHGLGAALLIGWRLRRSRPARRAAPCGGPAR